MKKLVLILLSVWLMFSSIGAWQAIAEEDSQLYYLWDIPFGVSEREFIERAYAKTGFNFLPHSGEEEESFIITTDENQSVSFLGHPLVGAGAQFDVDPDGSTNYRSLSLFFDVREETIPEALSIFDSVRFALEEKYGVPSFAALSADDGTYVTCDAIQGDFDAQQVAGIMITDDTIGLLGMVWKNIELFLIRMNDDWLIMMLRASTSIQDPPGPLRSLEEYQNRNKPSDAGL